MVNFSSGNQCFGQISANQEGCQLLRTSALCGKAGQSFVTIKMVDSM